MTSAWQEINTNLEAVSLLTVSRIAKGLPLPEREAFHALGLKYAEVAIHEEWPGDAGATGQPRQPEGAERYVETAG